MSTHDLNDMQRYLVEEEAEKWQEGRLTRRDFMRRVSLIVGAAAAGGVLMSLGCDPNLPATTVPEATATVTGAPVAAPEPTASPAATAGVTPASSAESSSPFHVPEGDPDVRAEMVEIPSSDSSFKLLGYFAVFATPKMGPGKPPGVLVIHENRGLTDHIKDVVRRVAKAGYVGLCVDLVSREGGSASLEESERTGALGRLQPEQAIADLSAGLDYLKSEAGGAAPDRLGVTGFCFGGGYTWRLATKRPDLKAAVPYYGPNPPLEDVPNIEAAVLGIYGGNDARITGQVPALEDALKKAGITYEIKIYEGANHAFHNDTGQNYKRDAAVDAWEKTLDWFGKYL
ncbi:MAG TPA: dienelactone hydrolase family protein [Chloroflexia bacterium]